MEGSTHLVPPLQAGSFGVSLKSQHFTDILADQPSVDFFEVHAENFMSVGGVHHQYLEQIAESYQLSVHGVGMSLGSAEGLSLEHMRRFRSVLERYKPALVSEHLAWSSRGGVYFNDLLPLPLNEESLKIVGDNVSRLQDFIGRPILIENPSNYVAFGQSTIPEPVFLSNLSDVTGCGLLLDINNVFVSAQNLELDAWGYFPGLDFSKVGEIHLAGHLKRTLDDGNIILVDDHGSSVSDDVLKLFKQVCSLGELPPVLVEWDNNIPSLEKLVAEVERVRSAFQGMNREASVVS